MDQKCNFCVPLLLMLSRSLSNLGSEAVSPGNLSLLSPSLHSPSLVSPGNSRSESLDNSRLSYKIYLDLSQARICLVLMLIKPISRSLLPVPPAPGSHSTWHDGSQVFITIHTLAIRYSQLYITWPSGILNYTYTYIGCQVFTTIHTLAIRYSQLYLHWMSGIHNYTYLGHQVFTTIHNLAVRYSQLYITWQSGIHNYT